MTNIQFKNKLKKLFISNHTKTKENNNNSYYKSSENEKQQIPSIDKLYERYFGKITDGVFVEFGAYDGKLVCNSSILAELGWNGYFIEPVQKYYKKCVARYASQKKITVSNIAFGPKAGLLTLYVGGVLTTASEAMRKNFEKLPWAKGCLEETTINVKMVTLDSYLKKYSIPQNFELLSIDVEGFEWEVLRDFPLNIWKPKMVIIELHDQNDDYKMFWDVNEKLVRYFEKNNYRVIYKDFSNTIYVPWKGK